jgi:hypothetical protein
MSEPASMEGGKKRSAWMTHVKKTMKANKGKPLSAVLKMAKKTYKKTMRGGGVAETAAPLSGGRRRSRRGGVEEEDENGKMSFPPMQVRRGGRKSRKTKKNVFKLF